MRKSRLFMSAAVACLAGSMAVLQQQSIGMTIQERKQFQMNGHSGKQSGKTLKQIMRKFQWYLVPMQQR